jgi:hypothetical protein
VLTQSLTRSKLHPARLLVIAAVLIIVAYITLTLAFARHREQRDALTAAVLDGETILAAAQSGESLESLRARLADVTALQQEFEGAFPAELKTPDVVETVLARAAEHNVTVQRIDIGSPEAIEFEAPPVDPATPAAPRSFTRAVVNAQARGSLADLTAFMAALEQQVSAASRLAQVSLQAAEGGFVLDFEVHTFARQPGTPASATPAAATAEAGG